MAGEVTERPSWNPLRCSGTELAPNVLLAAKLIALCLILTNHHTRLPADPFLPFLPFLEALGPPFPFEVVTKGVFFGAALALLFNRNVRTSALLLGGVIILCVVASKAYYGNNKLFCGVFLLLAGLQKPGQEPWLLRWQVALVYLGAALNKWLDPDWQTGQFFEHWGRVRLEQPFFIWLSDALPPLAAGKIFCWTALATETALGVGFLFRRAWPFAIWLGILFHTGAMWFTGSVFTMFYYAMLASYLVFAPWPKERLLVLYDGDCGFCETTRRFFERLDFDRIYDWQPFQGGAGDRWGIARTALENAAHVVASGKIYAGVRAFHAITLFNPLMYFILAVLLTLPGDGPSIFRHVLAGLVIALYFPLFWPVGEAAYQLVARNRHRLPGEKTCKVA
jgi:predicted DCC family thiol-disulfide oxidoreductase YuxK